MSLEENENRIKQMPSTFSVKSRRSAQLNYLRAKLSSPLAISFNNSLIKQKSDKMQSEKSSKTDLKFSRHVSNEQININRGDSSLSFSKHVSSLQNTEKDTPSTTGKTELELKLKVALHVSSAITKLMDNISRKTDSSLGSVIINDTSNKNNIRNYQKKFRFKFKFIGKIVLIMNNYFNKAKAETLSVTGNNLVDLDVVIY